MKVGPEVLVGITIMHAHIRTFVDVFVIYVHILTRLTNGFGWEPVCEHLFGWLGSGCWLLLVSDENKRRTHSLK